MRGKQVFMESLIGHGVEYIFGNPGTTESPILDALLDYPQLRYIVALHEGVALGAASYYAQTSGKPAVVSLHVAPGLGNALGMLYNAFKARVPLVVTAGQQDTRLRLRGPVLGHDLVAMATPLTKWSVQVERADEFALIMHRALKIATDPPAGPVFVALPIDVLEQETDLAPFAPGRLYRAPEPDPAGIQAAAQLLLGARRPAIVVGDDAASAAAEVTALAEQLGAAVWCEGIRARQAVPSTHPNFRLGLPFDAAAIRKALDGADVVLLVGGPFFEEVWYAPGSPLPPEAAAIQVESSPERLAHNLPVRVGLVSDPRAALAALRAAIGRGASRAFRDAATARNAALRALKTEDAQAQRARAAKRWEHAPISVPRLVAEIEAALPPDAIVVDESITASIDLARTVQFERPGDYVGARGGGIGQALPGALGVKLAQPERPVVALSGDGSAMYSIQALWTAAHHDLAVVFVILNNREYRILKHNMDTYRQRFGAKPDRAYPNMDLVAPDLGFVDLARGLGVEAMRVASPGELRPALEKALGARRPFLLDVAVEGRA
ncbi:MAG TPA: thiamine pyrophosphate-binding protein [Candidatus Deferrimicrobiaceae bacterium]|nr:thiamine pyrophosphate-binding protein [Candidatus Deferrimicrobiaceae bacterium]